MKYIYQTKRNTLYTYPKQTSKHICDTYSYHDPYFDKAILSESFSSFILLKELCIAQINATMTVNKQNGIQSAIMPLIHRYHSDQI